MKSPADSELNRTSELGLSFLNPNSEMQLVSRRGEEL